MHIVLNVNQRSTTNASSNVYSGLGEKICLTVSTPLFHPLLDRVTHVGVPSDCFGNKLVFWIMHVAQEGLKLGK